MKKINFIFGLLFLASSASALNWYSSGGGSGGGTLNGTISGASAGPVFYGGSGGTLAQDSPLNWDGTNDRLGVGTTSPASTLNLLGNNTDLKTFQVGVPGITNAFSVRNDGVTTIGGDAVSATAFQVIDGGLALHNSSVNATFTPEISMVKEIYDRDPEFVLAISSDTNSDYYDLWAYNTSLPNFSRLMRFSTDGTVYVSSGGLQAVGSLTGQSLSITGSGQTYGVIGTTQTRQFFEVNASTPMVLYTSTAAVALRVVWDFAGPDAVMGAATNTVVSVATAAYNGFARMDPSISSGPTNGVLYKWRAPDHFNTGVDLVLTDFIHYLGGTDTAVSTYTIAINAYASSSERPTSFLLPITFNTIADASGAVRDNESAADTTLTGWAAAITPGAQYWIYLGRNGGDPSTVETYAGELHIRGARSGTQ